MPVWIDDSSILISGYAGTGEAHYEDVVNDQLWSIDASSGAKKLLFSFPGKDLLEIVVDELRGVAFRKADEIVLTLCDRSNGSNVLVAVNLDTNEQRQLSVDGQNVGYLTGFRRPAGSNIRQAIAYIGQSAYEPPELWLASLDAVLPLPMTSLGDAAKRADLRRFALRTIQYSDPSLGPLRGSILLPAGWSDGASLPVVVIVYAGARLSEWESIFGMVGTTGILGAFGLVDRGYAVFSPDMPVRRGTVLRDVQSAVRSGLNALDASGLVRRTSTGLVGHSYGGFSVLAAIASGDRYDAAIALSGFSDWFVFASGVSIEGRNPGVTQAEERLPGPGGTPWNARDRYIENSPYFFLDQVQTPTLLIHGTADYVMDFNSRLTYGALRRLDKDAVLVLYPGVGHVLDATPEVEQDVRRRMVSWLKAYMPTEGDEPVGRLSKALLPESGAERRD